jgi:hypothetical protein
MNSDKFVDDFKFNLKIRKHLRICAKKDSGVWMAEVEDDYLQVYEKCIKEIQIVTEVDEREKGFDLVIRVGSVEEEKEDITLKWKGWNYSDQMNMNDVVSTTEHMRQNNKIYRLENQMDGFETSVITTCIRVSFFTFLIATVIYLLFMSNIVKDVTATQNKVNRLEYFLSHNGYNFLQGYDVAGNNIGYFPGRSIPELKSMCDKLDFCRGFTSGGYLKGNIEIDDLQKSHGVNTYVKSF